MYFSLKHWVRWFHWRLGLKGSRCFDYGFNSDHSLFEETEQLKARTLGLTITGIVCIVILYSVLSAPSIPPEYNNVSLFSINYTGLPVGENVRVYPKSHIITEDEFEIVFENKRNKRLYWGSYWFAEKYVNGTWVYWIPDNSAWTAELRTLFPFSRTVNKHNFPFEDGLYRITKKCRLTNNYDRERKMWVDEFTVTFYLVKES